MNEWTILIFQILVLIYSVVVHEVSHGAVANALGDSTAKDLGRLTLNPLRHLDPFGSVLLPLFLALIPGNSFIFGYAKPVPYDPRQLSDRRYGAAKVALAGPSANIAVAVLFGVAIRVAASFDAGLIATLFGYIVFINLILAVFNLVPIPPLDGHWLLNTFLPPRFMAFRVWMYRYSLPLLFLFIFFIFPLLYPVIAWGFSLLTGFDAGNIF